MAIAESLTTWLWFDADPLPGWQQMAIDRAMAERAAQDGTMLVRIYRWAGHTMSFGANESACRTWNRASLEAAGIACVRRPTGGRGVWHDADDLTYAAVAPVASIGGLRLAYRVIHEQLAGALRSLGLDAGVAPASDRRATLDPGACFDRAVGGEVLVGGRKTIGSAQAVFGTAMLQHGAIARKDRSEALARFRLVSAPVTPAVATATLPAAESVAEALLMAWRGAGGNPAPAQVIARVHSDAMAYADRYEDPAWTWRR